MKQYREVCAKCGARWIDAQLGLEQTPEEYVANMVAVFREVRRVLRDDGTCWLNLGDSYNANTGSGYPGTGQMRIGDSNRNTQRKRPDWLKPKDLVGIPWRVAFALQADGWWLRQDIIWHKPNPMPESVTDRCTKAHEYVFLLSKSARYFYDADAVREKKGEKTRRAITFRNDRYVNNETFNNSGGLRGKIKAIDGEPSESGRNRRSVWTITTKPYKGAHFATYPPALVEPCILAGTSERGACPACGSPWERVVEIDKSERVGPPSRGGNYNNRIVDDKVKVMAAGYEAGRQYKKDFIGWQPTCECDAGDPVPCVILDPFFGSGTTGEVAIKHGRQFVGLDLSMEYIELAKKRTSNINVMLPLGVS